MRSNSASKRVIIENGLWKIKCTCCGIHKEYHDYHRSRNGPYGLVTHCKMCQAKKSENFDFRTSHLKRSYNITMETYNRWVEEQQNKCGICHEEMETPYIDHCHKTGKVRGLLCMQCNMGLGAFRDNPEFLINAAAWIESKKDPE